MDRQPPPRDARAQAETRPLSPITRRVFLLAAPPAAGLVALGGCGGGAPYADCIYCDAPGQDYQECDTDYCDYFDYADAP